MLHELLGTRAELVMEVFDRFEAVHPRTQDHYYLRTFDLPDGGPTVTTMWRETPP
jgi:hypothetical protein